MTLSLADPYYFSKQAKRIQDQLDKLKNEPHLDNLSKHSFNSSRKHDMESIPTYAETKYLVDNGFNADLPRRNNSTTSELEWIWLTTKLHAEQLYFMHLCPVSQNEDTRLVNWDM